MEIRAKEIRRKVLEMIYKAQTSHIGSNFSCVDIMTVLYGRILNIDQDLKPDRDRFILSKGWAAATLYVLLAEKGIIPKEDLDTYCQEGSPYIGLVEKTVRGVEASTGSMGHGLPIGVGMALAAKQKGKKWRTYVLMSDGELNCGTTWESALIAAQHKLENLIVIVDRNGLQAMGETKEILKSNFEAFKEWNFISIPGHRYDAIEDAFNETQSNRMERRPTIIDARTTKGKGVSFMEDNNIWHYKNIDKESYEKAMIELS